MYYVRLKIFIIIITSLFVACSSAPEEAEPISVKKIKSGVIKIKGEITKSNKDIILAAINSDVKKIIITSNGGDIEPSIDIALKIRKLNIEVEVEEICFSSCFNYIFIAAQKRSIKQGGLLGYHGAIETSLPPVIGILFKKQLNKEKLFLEKIGLEPGLYKAIDDYTNEKFSEKSYDYDMLLIGKRFFEQYGFSLNNAWFPADQNEIDIITTKIAIKYGKALKMLGVYL